MAIITKVSAQKKLGRYNVFLDGQYAFSASEQTVAKFLLLKGQELAPEKILQVKQYDLDAKATSLASNYLSYEPRTIYEILQYLSKHNIAEESAQNAVNQLSEMGFLDDQKYVALALNQNLRIGTDGPTSFLQKMLQKGITSEIVQSQFAQISDDQWLDVGMRVVKSMQHQVGKLAQRELERKTRTKLVSHGFSSSLADSVISKMNLQLDECQQFEALKKQGIKAYKRFRRLTSQNREIKMRNYLYTHGFSSNEIESFIAGEVIPLSELAKY